MRKATTNEFETMLTFSCAMALCSWLEDQSPKPAEDAPENERIEYETMMSLATAVHDEAILALTLLGRGVSDEQIADAEKRIEAMKAKAFDDEGEVFQVFTNMVLARLSDHLFIPKRRNGKPKKNGWIKDPERRKLIERVQDAVVGLHLFFDPEYDDEESIEKGENGRILMAVS